MRFTSSQNKRTIIAIFIVFIITAETVAFVTITPRPQERLFQFYVLGSRRLVADYYPQNNTNLRVASPVSWYVAVTNSMGNVQLVEVRFKLGNETTTPPNDTSNTAVIGARTHSIRPISDGQRDLGISIRLERNERDHDSWICAYSQHTNQQ